MRHRALRRQAWNLLFPVHGNGMERPGRGLRPMIPRLLIGDGPAARLCAPCRGADRGCWKCSETDSVPYGVTESIGDAAARLSSPRVKSDSDHYFNQAHDAS